MKKKKPANGVGEVVQGDILPTIEFDFLGTVEDPENWTRGPLRVVTAVEAAPRKKGHAQPRPKKRTRRSA